MHKSLNVIRALFEEAPKHFNKLTIKIWLLHSSYLKALTSISFPILMTFKIFWQNFIGSSCSSVVWGLQIHVFVKYPRVG